MSPYERPAKGDWHDAGRPTSPAGGDPAPPPHPPPHPPAHPDDDTDQRRGGVGYATYAITVAVLLLAIAVVVFVLQNNRQVEISLFWSKRYMSVAGALAASATAGLAVGLLAGFIPQIKLRRELRVLRRGTRG